MAKVQRGGPGHAEADAGLPDVAPRRQGRLPAQPAAARHVRPGAGGRHQRLHRLGLDRERQGRRPDDRAERPGRTGEDVEGPVLPVAGGQQPHQPRREPTRRRRCCKTVAGEQKEDGHLDAEKTSITGSGGRDLQIETTALAVLGWLKANPGAFNAAAAKGRQVDRPAARRLRRLRLDAIDHPGAEGADRLHQRQQADGGGRRTAAVRRRQTGGGSCRSRPARRTR